MIEKNARQQNKEILKYAGFFFLFLLIYSFTVINHFSPWEIDYNGYTVYLLDYGFGFCSRLLPGAVYHLFFKEVIPWQLNIVLTVLLLMFFACISILAAKILAAQTSVKVKNKLMLLFLFLMSGPSFLSALSGEFGMYDQYWVFFALAFVLIASKKYLRLFVPLLFGLCILIHYSSFFSFILLFSIILCYEAAERKGKEKVLYIVLLLLSLAIAVGLAYYFIRYEKSNFAYSLEDFRKEVARRNHLGENTKNVNMSYLESTFYNVTPLEDWGRLMEEYYANPWIDANRTVLPMSIVSIINAIGAYFVGWSYYISQHLLLYISTFLVFELITLPFTLLFYRYWGYKFRQQAQKGKKFVYVLCMLQFPCTLAGCLLSTDMMKWLMFAFLIQFVLFLYICHKEKEFSFIEQNGFLAADNTFLFLYYCCYAVLYQTPYTFQ